MCLSWKPRCQQILRHWFTDFETTSAFHVDLIVCTSTSKGQLTECSLIWSWPARVPLFSIKLPGSNSRYSESHVPWCGHSGMLLTQYHPREVRNSIYRYRKFHINYRSKYPYRFISTVSIVYWNSNPKAAPQTVMGCFNSQVKHPKYNHYSGGLTVALTSWGVSLASDAKRHLGLLQQNWYIRPKTS